MNTLKIWFIAARPWSFTGTLMPGLVGSFLAAAEGYFQFWPFLLAVAGGVLAQGATNYLNTYGDYMSGVDTVESAVTCGQLVSGLLKPKPMRNLGIFILGIVILIGLVLCLVSGWRLLFAGLFGVFGVAFYTSIKPYKYIGLGSIAVFLFMGPVITLGAYFVQTSAYSWSALLASLPVGLLAGAITHGNEIRDIEYDRSAGIITIPMKIGRSKAYTVYYAVNILAFVLVILLAVCAMPDSADNA